MKALLFELFLSQAEDGHVCSVTNAHNGKTKVVYDEMTEEKTETITLFHSLQSPDGFKNLWNIMVYYWVFQNNPARETDKRISYIQYVRRLSMKFEYTSNNIIAMVKLLSENICFPIWL